jgi:perosamine synthetase
MPNKKIPLFEPFINLKEKQYVLDCLKTNWISSKGKYIEKFQNKFSKYVGATYSISVNNGTAALHLALLALDVKKGDEVIVPSFTYVAAVNAIKYVGAKVVFIDVNFLTSQIDESLLEKKITKKTKALIVPHLYGQSAEIEKIKKICKKKKVCLVEDCAESFGCFFNQKHLGTFGEIGTFSFFGSKTITTGEGGMVVTSNKKLANKINKLKTQGVVRKKNDYWHDIIGYNYRMTNICAAIGLAQLEKKDLILKKKNNVFNFYKKKLNSDNTRMNLVIKNSISSYWQIVIYLKNKKIRDSLKKFLEQNKVETRTTFPPVHTMPMYYKKKKKELLPNTLTLSNTGICLPSGPSLKEKEIFFICKLINNFLKSF